MSLLYTPLPLEDILSDETSRSKNFTEVQVEGKTLIIEPVNSYEARVTKLISSDPYDFMDPRFQPGSVIKYYPGVEQTERQQK